MHDLRNQDAAGRILLCLRRLRFYQRLQLILSGIASDAVLSTDLIGALRAGGRGAGLRVGSPSEWLSCGSVTAAGLDSTMLC